VLHHVAQHALLPEAALEVAINGGVVEIVHAQADAVQLKVLEADAQQRLHHALADAPAALGGVAHQHAGDAPGPVALADATEGNVAHRNPGF